MFKIVIEFIRIRRTDFCVRRSPFCNADYIKFIVNQRPIANRRLYALVFEAHHRVELLKLHMQAATHKVHHAC